MNTQIESSGQKPWRQQNSYMDPHGYVVRDNNSILRVLHPNSQAFYRDLLRNPAVNRLQANGMLIAASQKEDADTVLRHPVIWPVTYATEWTPSALRDAGLLTLAIAEELADEDLTLQDATPFNVLFTKGRPIFVDFTSIVPQNPHILWKAQSQYEAFFLHPLLLASQGKGVAARHALSDPVGGLSEEWFLRHVSLSYRLAHPQEAITRRVAHWIQNDAARRKRFVEAVRTGTHIPDKNLRKRYFRKLAARLQSLNFPKSTDMWKDYYAEIPEWVDKQHKVAQIDALLRRMRPRTVVDIGANTGIFSALAGSVAESIVAAEGSQSCTETIYAMAQSRALPIFPVCCNLISPPLPSGMLPGDYPSLWDRLRSETTLCLGLMHHLHVSGRQPFTRIALMLNALTEKSLIFEYIAPDDENVQRLNLLEPSRYELEDVRQALGLHFSNIETLDSDRPTRKILLCQK